jgi:hypothetical protein
MQVILLKPEQLIAMRQASLLSHKMAICINDDGSFQGIVIEAYINNVVRTFWVDENLERNIREAYSNPLKTNFK